MFTNRELYFRVKKQDNKAHKIELKDSEIYELLIAANKYKDYTDLITHFDEEIKDEKLFEKYLRKIYSGKPLQYVLNKVEFCGLNIVLNNHVLIPRTETEFLVNRMIEIINKNKLNKKEICDVCCGSGCIALALKNNYKNSNVYALDYYINPLRITKLNSENLNLNLEIYKSNKLDVLLKNCTKLDILVSNPPYVENKDDIEDNVKLNEPMNAIYSKNGISFYESYFKNYKKIMNKKFFMAFEINYDQREKLTCSINKYFDVKNIKYKFEKDLYNKDRYLFILGGYENANF